MDEWIGFSKKQPENNRKLKIVLLGNGERTVFYNNGKFYKNKAQGDRGRELEYICSYEPYLLPKQNMATHWKYI